MADKFEQCSAETVKRFKDFVRTRADIQRVFDVSRSTGELASAHTIEYEYEKSDDDKQEPDEAEMTINGGVVPGDDLTLLCLFVDGKGKIQYGGEGIGNPSDTTVNTILDTTEQLEAAGRITPPVPSA